MHVWIHFVAFMKIIAEQFSSARLNWHDWESPNLLDNKDEKVCLLHTSCYVAFGKKIVSGTGSTYHITDFPLQVGIYQIQQNMIHRTVKKREHYYQAFPEKCNANKECRPIISLLHIYIPYEDKKKVELIFSCLEASDIQIPTYSK